MRAAVEFIEHHWLPLFAGLAAVVMAVEGMTVAALVAAFIAGNNFRERH